MSGHHSQEQRDTLWHKTKMIFASFSPCLFPFGKGDWNRVAHHSPRKKVEEDYTWQGLGIITATVASLDG